VVVAVVGTAGPGVVVLVVVVVWAVPVTMGTAGNLFGTVAGLP
jgi:hypothetical protein